MSTTPANKRKATDDGSEASKRSKTSSSMAKSTRGNITKVLVGPNKVQFLVHTDLLVEHSPFFAAKAKPCWLETASSVDLDHVSEQGFEIVIDWIYRKEVPTLSTTSDNVKCSEYMNAIRKGYKTADQLLMTDLQDRLFETLKAHIKARDFCCTWTAVIVFGSENLLHTPLYKFTLKSVVSGHLTFPDPVQRLEECLENMAHYPEVWKDVLRYMTMFSVSPWQDPAQSTDCEFHIHAKDAPCPLA